MIKAPSAQLLAALRRASASPLHRHPERHLRVGSYFRCASRGDHPLHVGSHALSTTAVARAARGGPPKSRDRGPDSKEDTQTDFGAMDVLANMVPPSTCIDACLSNGFHFDNGMKINDGSGCLMISGEAFSWRPWESKGDSLHSMINTKGQWEVDQIAWGALELVWPKPELLILGLGASVYPISPTTRRHINSLGIRVDVQDTRNAAAQFNLLATERGVGNIAAALIPLGWKGGKVG